MKINEETIRTTVDEIESFKGSTLWIDIQDELIDLAQRAQLEYDIVGESHSDDAGYKVIPNSSEALIHLGDIKGRRKAVNYFLNILDIFLQILEDKKNDSKRSTTD
jgi:hypothetical protein